MSDSKSYRERMWPTVWMFVLFALIFPAVILLFQPLNVVIGYILAPVVYVIVVGIICLAAPVLRVADGKFFAGQAVIDCRQLGEVTILDRNQLTLQLGIHADARAFTLIRGWIHSGILVRNEDPEDPAPYWLVTTRHPEQLKAAIEAARSPRPH